MFTMQSQLFRHRPEEGVYGDCHRTCVANIIGVHPSNVPHEHRDMSGDELVAQINTYLSPLGLIQIAAWWPQTIDYILKIHGNLNPDLNYILSGRTKRDVDHSVLCMGGTIIKNPSLDPDNDLVAHRPDGQFQTTYIVPARGPFRSEADFEQTVRSWRIKHVLTQ